MPGCSRRSGAGVLEATTRKLTAISDPRRTTTAAIWKRERGEKVDSSGIRAVAVASTNYFFILVVVPLHTFSRNLR